MLSVANEGLHGPRCYAGKLKYYIVKIRSQIFFKNKKVKNITKTVLCHFSIFLSIHMQCTLEYSCSFPLLVSLPPHQGPNLPISLLYKSQVFPL